MNKEFAKLFGYAKKLRSRYINTLNAFNVYSNIAFYQKQNPCYNKNTKNK